MSGHPRRRSGKRGGHDEAHGGQWKIAYADFVTAMMAFFLLMWLVSSATETQRAVIAKYFTTTSIFDLPKGNGVLDGGKAVMAGAEAKTERLLPSGKGGSDQQKPADAEVRDDQKAATAAVMERQRFEALKAELEKMMRDGELKDLANNLSIDLTPEGLRIQVFDRDGEAMFASGDAEPTPRLSRIIDVIGDVLKTVKNGAIVAGHTDGQVLKRGAYSNWELSTDRANSVRRRLETTGLGSSRFLRVEGVAATDPLLPLSPLDPRNRRIAITVLRAEVEAQMRGQTAPAAGAPP
jgi:chemotaxis protein MotB